MSSCRVIGRLADWLLDAIASLRALRSFQGWWRRKEGGREGGLGSGRPPPAGSPRWVSGGGGGAVGCRHGALLWFNWPERGGTRASDEEEEEEEEEQEGSLSPLILIM